MASTDDTVVVDQSIPRERGHRTQLHDKNWHVRALSFS